MRLWRLLHVRLPPLRSLLGLELQLSPQLLTQGRLLLLQFLQRTLLLLLFVQLLALLLLFGRLFAMRRFECRMISNAGAGAGIRTGL